MAEQRQQRIVVGVDGSSGSLVAARWAIDEAKARGAGLELVYTWHLPYLVDASGYSLSVQGSTGEWNDMAVAADEVMAEIVGRLGDTSGVELTTRALEGAPAATLMETAKGADLLVVGRRGHGGFLGLHVGSVATQLSHHFDGVLVIVPEIDAA